MFEEGDEALIETTAQECLGAIGGNLLAGNSTRRFRGVSIDSRTVREGNLFFCIRGERFDGHDFISEVIRKSAAGIVLSQQGEVPASLTGPSGSESPFVIRVEDTLRALQELARHHREKFPIRIIGITGTNGKSTTKEMVASVAEMKFETLRNRGNLNNHIGLPLTLMELGPHHQVAALEMGMSAAGEIRRLAEIARPDIGIITNISEAHLEELRTLKNVQKAKGELFEALPQNGTAIINADDPLVLELARSLRARTQITFGIDNRADVRASEIRPRDDEGFDFTVNLFDRKIPVFLPFPGRCNIYNALAALATGHSLGIDPDAMQTGLGQCRLLSQRNEMIEHGGITWINDSYNANPRSMREALDTLVRRKTPGKKIFALGEMRELADRSQSAHRELGRDIAAEPVDFLVTVGPLAALAAQGARETGMHADRIHSFASHAEAIAWLSKHLQPGDLVLVKGSRGAKMEEIIKGLTQP
ncbi:MAG: hypothetical protein COV67_06085 [Nitrospinae bacterium CG11_big_fil_rev_8_21_14_0_20_56_8]|nr:MAG: hypothetical protein COV67_06085 [Nitrospinae bacterium CG11_big_fil_rev_8_21_14_0_20_56_8]